MYRVYTVLSELTLALLSDSGWYEVNYTVAESSVQGYNIPLLYGKGKNYFSLTVAATKL